MPRIRTLKPEHKSHRKVGLLSHFEYRLWVGLITEADDEGRLVADPAQLRALIFPYLPEMTHQIMENGLESLKSAGLIRRYSFKKVGYICFPSWAEHQRISHPYKSKLPAPPGRPRSAPIPERSGAFTEHSTGIKDQGMDQGSRIKDQGVDQGRERSAEGRETGAPAARLEGAPAPSQANGTSPARHAYQRIVERLQRDHPELTAPETEQRALLLFSGGVRT